MKTNSAFNIVKIMIVIAIIGLLAAIAIPNFYAARQNDLKYREARAQEVEKSVEVGSNRELFTYSGYETGMVTRIIELPGTPLGTSFPVAEVAMTNDNGSTVLRGSFPQDSKGLKKGDSVLITTIRYNYIGGGSSVRLITKLPQ